LKLFFYIFLLINSLVGVSRPPLDSNYIEDLSDSLVVRLLAISKFSSVEIEDDKTDERVSYAPLSGINVGVGFAYKWLGVNLALRIPGSDFSSGDNKTKGIDLRVHSFGRRFGFDASYSHFKGYEVENPQETPGGTGDDFRTDLYSTSLSFSGYFNMNPSKFSLRAVTLQNERQLKSAGAPILGVYANSITLGTSDSVAILSNTVLPGDDLERFFSADLHFKKVHSFNLGVNGGYIYTLVFKKKLFFTLGLNLGVGYDYSDYSFSDSKSSQVSQLHVFSVGRLAIGYNSDEYYFGLISYIEENVLGVDDHRIRFETGELRLVLAKRFSGKFGLLDKLYKTKLAKLFSPKEKK
jgi:hypothetical protein